jgi:hypothetical protein
MPREPDRQLLDYLRAYDRTVADMALGLREMILEEAGDAVERVYQTYTVAIWFGFTRKMKDSYCFITTSSDHVNLGFNFGATLPDPNHVLEGEGKQIRHIKFRSLRDLERPFVRRYIRASMEQVAASSAKPVQKKAATRR